MRPLSIAKNVLQQEAKALEIACQKLEASQIEKLLVIFSHLRKSGGSLITCGVGKSGIIAQKISSTFSSLGLPSFYLHPTEALHGDLGRVHPDSAILLISKSGTTEEIVKLLPYLPLKKDFMIGLIGDKKSLIAEKCSLVFDCSVESEACLNNLAPTTSTTVALAIGDMLAVLFEDFVGLSKEGFALNHPGGLLGKSLSLKVSDLMLTENLCPQVQSNQTLQDVILSMTKFPVGLCAIIDNNEFKGIIVEGDIRRTLSIAGKNLATSVAEIMNTKPLFIAPDQLAFEALELMEKRERPVTVIPVLLAKKFLGAIRIHDLLKEGFKTK